MAENIKQDQKFANEAEYRACVQRFLKRIELAFEDVDPDVAECEQQFGALSIRFPSGARCILSAQPSVQQLWLALAAKGIAFHFNYDHAGQRWVDDKGKNIELMSYLRSYLEETTGLDFSAIGG